MCTVLLPPGDNPIAVNKYINLESYAFRLFMLYNYITMHGAKNIKMMLNSEVT